MNLGNISIVLLCVIFYFQETIQAKAQKCRQTNKKPYRYCLDQQCTSDSGCGKNKKCLCDGDCGLTCVPNALNCGKPETPKGIRVRYSNGTRFNSIATFRCQGKQYTLRGSRKRVCRGIGKWNGRPAKCRILCRNPGDIAYGNNNGDKKFYREGTTVRYWCFPGYNIEGDNILTCNNKAKWNKSPPKCALPSCSKPKLPLNAYIKTRQKLKQKYRFNEIIALRCEVGYHSTGSIYQRCLIKGWSNPNLRCIPKSCGDPGTPTNGKRQGYVFTFKNKVFFKCNRGFMRVGPEYRQCQSNQRWSAKTPTCEPVDCGRLPVPQYGEKIEETTTTYGGKVVFQCKKEGYDLKGSKQRFCQENGKWDGTITTCEPVECKNPGIPVNGGRIPDKDKYVFEDRIDFQCKANYTIRGDSFIICRKTKDWTGSVPQCLAPCSDPGIPVGGRRLQHSFLHSKVVQFQCNRGWSMEGAHTIRCTNGQWDYTAPTCSDCGSALGMENNKIPDGNIRASSVGDWYRQGKDGRLNGPRAWCSGSEQDPYIQIDFGKPYQLTSLATQGSAVDNKWVGSFAVKTNLAGSRFTPYREHNTDKMFQGNTNGSSVVRNRFSERIIARRIRIYPMKLGGFLRQPACMRVEIYGCDLPLDCVMIKSRVVAKWNSQYYGGYIYYKAYLTDTTNRAWKVELENESHGNPKYKKILKYEDLLFVLDVPPRHEELQVGTRVLAPWGSRYYTGTIMTARDSNNRYQVRADDNDRKMFTIDQIRLLKAPTFCN